MLRAVCAALCVTTFPAYADGFRTITNGDDFVSLVKDRELKRFGITLRVTPEGDIDGSAFGTQVSGAWRWEDGFFCRDLYYGQRDLGPNCQVVQQRGETLRFIADQGQGQSADLRLE